MVCSYIECKGRWTFEGTPCRRFDLTSTITYLSLDSLHLDLIIQMPSAIIQSLPTFPLYEYQSPKSNHQVKPAPDPLLLVSVLDLILHSLQLTHIEFPQIYQISPPLTASPHPWASSSAQCLRTQLLFLLARVPAVSYRTWGDEASVPGGDCRSRLRPLRVQLG